MASAAREQWSSRTGFVLAAVGSAVGLGNMWRFSYMTAEKGGAAFVALYLLLTLMVGLPVLVAELIVGRGSGRSPILALAHYGGQRWRALGGVFVVAGFTILAYYSVIAGWTVRYALSAVATGYPENPGDYFGEVSSGWDAFGFHLAFMALTVGVVAGGVKRGIERVSLVMMPLLFVLVVGIAVYASTLSGAGDGYRYYLNLDVANVLDLDVLVDAASQAFFSLSLGMGAMLTFASYLPRDHDLPKEAGMIAGADMGVAFVAGLMVFPLIFALGLSEDVGGSTLGALFVTLPKAFASMGEAGRIVGVAFFMALVVGALTSAMSLLEVVVSSAIDTLGWTRRRAALVLGGAIALVGTPAAWNLGVLDLMDQVANNVLLLGGGLALAIFTGWVVQDPSREFHAGAGGWRGYAGWYFVLRFIAPVILFAVFCIGAWRTLVNLVAFATG
ncbi:MAG: sodium-dependent transporter [Proteobacteria bacterium]|nr:sodium-dependent transporter [Pseudomonadota bacterium]